MASTIAAHAARIVAGALLPRRVDATLMTPHATCMARPVLAHAARKLEGLLKVINARVGARRSLITIGFPELLWEDTLSTDRPYDSQVLLKGFAKG